MDKKEMDRLYYLRNKSRILERRRQRYQENKEKELEQSKKYYDEHKDEISEYYKQYQEANSDKLKQYKKGFYSTMHGRALRLLGHYRREDKKYKRGECTLTEQWIIEDSARNEHTSNQKQLSVTQRCYKGDPEFEFIEAGRDKLNYTSNILEVDTWNGTSGSYPGKMSNCLIAINSYSGEEIEYTIYFNGDPTEGTVAIAGGVPTFTPTTSL